jgi:osmoprotectant transport system ATP-binding protein
MLQVKNLTKKFANQVAVHQVSFEVEEGEKLILLGTSGSGKSTCLKMINRLIEPTEGEIWLNGQNVLAQNPEKLRREIGYIIQSIGLFPHYTVAQNIGLVPSLLKWTKSKTEARTKELLEMLQLDADTYLHRYPHELSGGQRQRIGIARALAVNPPLLLMDEPFGALDPITREQIQKDFQEIESLASKTLVMVTHDVFEAVSLGTKICLLDAGKIQQIGSPYELLFHPENQFVEDFFQPARFQLELQIVKVKDIQKYLSNQTQSIQDSEIESGFTLQSRLLEILEQTADASNEEFIYIHITDNQYLQTSREEILKAFYTWKLKKR